MYLLVEDKLRWSNSFFIILVVYRALVVFFSCERQSDFRASIMLYFEVFKRICIAIEVLAKEKKTLVSLELSNRPYFWPLIRWMDKLTWYVDSGCWQRYFCCCHSLSTVEQKKVIVDQLVVLRTNWSTYINVKTWLKRSRRPLIQQNPNWY